MFTESNHTSPGNQHKGSVLRQHNKNSRDLQFKLEPIMEEKHGRAEAFSHGHHQSYDSNTNGGNQKN